MAPIFPPIVQCWDDFYSTWVLAVDEVLDETSVFMDGTRLRLCAIDIDDNGTVSAVLHVLVDYDHQLLALIDFQLRLES